MWGSAVTFGEATDRPSTGSIRLPRRYWVFLAARVVTLSGSAMAPVALALALLDRQRDATGLGVVLLMDVLGQLTFVLVGGVLGDRRGAGWALVVGNAVSGVAQAGAGILIAFDNPPIAGIAMM